MNRNIALATLGLSLAVQTGIAEAAFTEFAWDFQSGTFAASLQGPAFDSFNNLTGFASPPSLTRQAGAYSYTVSAPGNLLVLPQSFGPDPILALSTVSASTTISFTQFTGNASAIGMFIFTTNSDGSLADTNPVFMTATDSAGAVFVPLPIDTYVSRGSGFFSLKSDSRIVSLMLSVQTNSQVALYASVDGLVLGVAAIPEPATYLQMLAGLGFMGLVLFVSGYRSRRSSRLLVTQRR